MYGRKGVKMQVGGPDRRANGKYGLLRRGTFGFGEAAVAGLGLYQTESDTEFVFWEGSSLLVSFR